MKRKIVILSGIVLFIILTVVVFYMGKEKKRADIRKESVEIELQKEAQEESVGTEPQKEDAENVLEQKKELIRIEDPFFERLSEKEIRIAWSDQKNPYVCEYYIQRRSMGSQSWERRGVVVSDGKAENRELSYVDLLEAPEPQQYEYRIDVKIAEEVLYEAVEGKCILASNLLVCIDPGHFAGQNVVTVDGASYAEGDFTLDLALELKKVLKESCGITSYLTRETGSISIGGYTDSVLDYEHISLRGEFAAGSNLFLSLHTNANLDGANGYPTVAQPIDIMKPIIIVNTAVNENEPAWSVGNAVGIYLAKANEELGIGLPDKFRKLERRDELVQWTDAWNDSVDMQGTLCCRLSEYGYGDYYGVLRGAADVGVPGMIIEHGFHTVPEMREKAALGELKVQWARADAKGIAEGFHFNYERMEEKEDVL